MVRVKCNGSTVRGDNWSVATVLDGKLTECQRFNGDAVSRTPVVLDGGAGPAVVTVLADGTPLLERPGPGRFEYLALEFSGREDKGNAMRSNASGIGTHYAVRIGSAWVTGDTFRANTGPGQGVQPVSIGLAGAARADFVAINWSDGVFQTELGLEAGKLHRIEETQRQLSSCPVLFAWDGEKYAFISDLLGVGGIGFAVGPGVYSQPRPWENFLIAGHKIQTRAGKLSIKIAEPMEEVCYLDSVRMSAWVASVRLVHDLGRTHGDQRFPAHGRARVLSGNAAARFGRE